MGTPLYLVNQDWYNAWISFTKQSFSLLMITLTEFWAPTKVKISGDESVRGQLFQTTDGDLICNFPQRMVMMANHQIYTDWLYLWWIAYTNGMHGRIYIVLKESLKKIPIIGWGMQLSRFIFLKRNWEQDRPRLAAHLKQLARGLDPMWLLMFPEGTNLAPSTRAKSREWAAKKGIQDMQHTLLPRGTGLQFCLRELRGSIRWVYDCTIAYEGVPRGAYAQDVYTLQAQYGQGKPPKCLHMHWRRFHISSVPLDDPVAFELWLRARWIEKDYLIEHFYHHGRFPMDTGVTKTARGVRRKGAGLIETRIRAQNWYEYLQTFAPVGLLGLVLYSVYGALPKKFVDRIKELSAKRMAALQATAAGVFNRSVLPRLNDVAMSNPLIAAARAGKLPGFKVNMPEDQKAMLRSVLPKSFADQIPAGQGLAKGAPGRKALPAPPVKASMAKKLPPAVTTEKKPTPKKPVTAEPSAVAGSNSVAPGKKAPTVMTLPSSASSVSGASSTPPKKLGPSKANSKAAVPVSRGPNGVVKTPMVKQPAAPSQASSAATVKKQAANTGAKPLPKTSPAAAAKLPSRPS